MQISLHPLNLLVYTIAAGVVVAVVRLVVSMRSDDDELFGFSALSITGWLAAFSFLSGFSIGWFVSIMTTVLGIIFLLVAKRYRVQISIATLISGLLALSLRGIFVHGRILIWAILITVAVVGLYFLTTALRRSDIRTAGSYLLVAVGSLSGLALIIQGSITIWITSLAIAGSIPGIIFAKRFRLEFVLIMVADILWLMNSIYQFYS